MSELRRDPIVDRWVIVSAERASRPVGFTLDSNKADADSFCPFCAGNESSTPPEELCYGRDEGALADSLGWDLRVVPNKFPALSAAGSLTTMKKSMYDVMSGIGVSEVIIETPHHNLTLVDMEGAGVERLFLAVKERFVSYRADPRLRCAQFFKNHGFMSGASLPHSHSQIIVMPVVSKLLGEELDGSRKYFEAEGRCVYCDIIADEKVTGERLVYKNSGFIVITPYASRFPYETWIMPTNHSSRYEFIDSHSISMLADAVGQALNRTNKVLGNPPYNMMLHTSPFHSNHEGYYHWHFEILPVQGRAAGFEWGSGFHINSTPPEFAARRLREAM